jgi:hypothetical protein
MNPRVTYEIRICLGLLGVLAWVWSVPYYVITTEEWGPALALLLLAALVLVVTISSVALMNSYWVRFTPALLWLKLASVIGVVVGLVSFLPWLDLAFTPLCMSTEPITTPGVCPPVPNASEWWGGLVALVLLINLSAFVLVKSFRRPRMVQIQLTT